MDYKKKYIKYKQKYKTIKYGGSIHSKNSTTYKKNGSNNPIRRKPPPPDVHISSIMFSDFEDYKTTMNLFYELSQLNLEAEKLHQEILDAGFHLFNLTYYSWIWTVGDNHQFADMNKGYKQSTEKILWEPSGVRKPQEWDKTSSEVMKKSKVKFAFLSNQKSNGPSGYWLYDKSPHTHQPFFH